jgi:molybdate transport system permease protein
MKGPADERQPDRGAGLGPSAGPVRPHRPGSDLPFFAGLGLLAAFYIGLILAMLAADVAYAVGSAGGRGGMLAILSDANIRYAVKLSLISCSITTVLALWVAVPVGYLMSRFDFRGKTFVDAVLDIPIVLPPLVIGLSLLILFRQTF